MFLQNPKKTRPTRGCIVRAISRLCLRREPSSDTIQRISSRLPQFLSGRCLMLRPSRRQWLKAASLGLLGYSASGWFPALAEKLASDPQRRRHCILLWMTGGPTQTDTFDMKPGHANGGQFKEVATKAPGLRFSEH